LNKKAVTVALLILLTTVLVFIPLSLVSGQGPLGVNIYQIAPQGTTTAQQYGNVGQAFNVQGTLDTQNGAYQIWLGDNLVASDNSEGYYVNGNFTIPEITGGNYTIILRDVKENVNATQQFTVVTAYSIKAVVPSAPALLQEGSTVTLNVNITGGQSSTAYNMNVSVALPTPLSTIYSKIITFTSNQKGTGQAQLTYPDPTFQPEGSTTNYTGLYQVYLNQSQGLATDQFFVGFTDLSTYHRNQPVIIRAIGYQSNEEAALTITYASTGAAVYSEPVTASGDGVIDTTWSVPSDALIGDYNITLTPQSTPKLVPDSQIITVPGYPVTITTFNLAGDPVPLISVQALDKATNTIYNATTGYDGKASVNLEKGNHTLTALWNDVKVGEIDVLITGESAFDLTCELTNLKITVQNKDGFLIPFVNLGITYQYVTTTEGASKTGSASGQTDLSGSFVLNSTLPGISYTINASLYGMVFNVGNNSVSSLPVQPISEVMILCPSWTLTLRILDYNFVAIPKARIELVEQTSGIFYGAETNDAGSVTIEVTFGMYRLRVYGANILLNETSVEVFNDVQSEIRCTLYNIQVSVKVVDYLGQPISNVHVVLHGPSTETLSGTTQAGGTAKFNNVIGGDMQIIAYPAGKENSYEAVNLQVEEPTSIKIIMAKYILLGPFLVETSILAAVIIILAALIIFISIEVYRRKRAKSDKAS
jgi:hypothetical protein